MADSDIEKKTIIGKITKGPTQDGNEKNTWIDVELLEPGQSQSFKWRAFEHQNTIREKAIWGKAYNWHVELKQVEGKKWPYRNIVGIGEEVEFPDVAPQAAQARTNGGSYASEDPNTRRVSIERQKAADLALQSFDVGARMSDRSQANDPMFVGGAPLDPLFTKSFPERLEYIHAAIVGSPIQQDPHTHETGGATPQNGRPADTPASEHMSIETINGVSDLMQYARQQRWPKASYDYVLEKTDYSDGQGWDAIRKGFVAYQERTKCTWRELATKMARAEDDAAVWAERTPDNADTGGTDGS